MRCMSLFELRSVGAEVVSVKDDLPEGDMGDVMRTLQYYSAKQQAESIAFASTVVRAHPYIWVRRRTVRHPR